MGLLHWSRANRTRICTNEGFRSIHKQTVHTLTRTSSHASLSVASSPVLLRHNTQACRCQPYLSSCCTTRPRRGAWACSKPLHLDPGSSFAGPAMVTPSTHPPRKTTTPKTLQPSHSRDRDSATAPPECPDAVMVEWVKVSLPPVLPHFFGPRYNFSKTTTI